MDSFSDFFWVFVGFFLLMGYLIVLFHIVIDLFRDRSLGGGAKALWVLFLVLVPLLASVTYLAVRGSGIPDRNPGGAEGPQQAAGTFARTVATWHTATDEIVRARDLHEAGHISDAEFERIKQKTLE